MCQMVLKKFGLAGSAGVCVQDAIQFGVHEKTLSLWVFWIDYKTIWNIEGHLVTRENFSNNTLGDL